MTLSSLKKVMTDPLTGSGDLRRGPSLLTTSARNHCPCPTEDSEIGTVVRKTMESNRLTDEDGGQGRIRSVSIAGVVLVVLGFLTWQAGCRTPTPPVLSKPVIAVHYDTHYEHTLLAQENRPALLDGIWDQYVETLDEPVCVTGWNDDVSEWQVLFATNRSSTGNGAAVSIGKGVEDVAHYGSATIQLPHRQRGEEPRRKAARLFPTAWRANDAKTEQPAADVVDVGTLTEQRFLENVSRQVAASRQHDVLLFVHGFNVDFESCLIRAAQLGLDLPFNGALIAYSWPTQGGVLNYSDDETINHASVGPFAEFLQRLTESLPADTQLNIVVHSMGNRIVMQALNQLPETGSRRPVQTVCLCAPDVGRADFALWIPGVVRRANRVLMYVNDSDTALLASKSLHVEQRSGDASPYTVSDGVEVIDCSGIDLSLMGHSYFSGNADVLADLFAVLKENKRPADRPWLRSADPKQSGVWQFADHPPQILWSWHFDDESD
ncbi:MAG: alpha/beta hydrolase [Planctomycetaceae bacterium]|nr:alpha/beta hydrolase [Planctomycetaceae bacterium]